MRKYEPISLELFQKKNGIDERDDIYDEVVGWQPIKWPTR